MSQKKKKNLDINKLVSKEQLKDLRKTLKVASTTDEGITLERRGKYNGPVIGPDNYHQFDVRTEIPGDASEEEIQRIRRADKRESNKIRAIAKRHLKAYLKGKSTITIGKDKVTGEPKQINISSNEFGFHKKV